MREAVLEELKIISNTGSPTVTIITHKNICSNQSDLLLHQVVIPFYTIYISFKVKVNI